MFVAKLKRPNQRKNDLGEKYSKNQLEIINAIQENRNITYQELALKVGISEVSIYRNIRKLIESDILVRKGSTKTGHWEVNS
jgi:predicted HTH transcriptional regulator